MDELAVLCVWRWCGDVLMTSGKFLCNCTGVCGKHRVNVRCVVVDHEEVVTDDFYESECIRMDLASRCKSGRL